MSFPAYPTYKDSGVEWLGGIPAHWNIKKFRYVFEESPEKITDEVVGDMLSVSGYRGIEVKQYDDEGRRRTDEELFGYRVVRAGQLVVNTMWLNYAGLGVSEHEGHVSPAYRSYWIDPAMDKRFIHHLMRSGTYVQGYTRLLTGIRPNSLQMGRDDLMIFPVLLPTKSEQTQIARFLDHETARIDALIAEQQRLIELLKEKRQAVISHAVTKGLDPTVPMKDSGVEWLGEVPAHWVCKSYRYASIIYRGKFSHRPRNDPSLYDGDFAFIQTGDIARAEKYIVEYKQTLNEKGASVSQKFPSGTLVMAIAANVGDTAILGFEAYAPDSVVGFKPERDIELEFLRFSLMAALQELKKTSTQSTQANLNIDRISGINSVFPPLAEQRSITVYLNEVMERFSLLEKQAEASIELMNERRSALISVAVTGKIDVRGWQPPADAATASVP